MAQDDDNKGNETLDLAKLIAEENQDKARQNEILSGRDKKEKRKKVGVIATVASVSLVLLVGIIIYDPFTQSLRWSDDPDKVPVYTGGTTNDYGKPMVDPYSWAKEPGAIFPVETKPWQETPYLDSSQEGYAEVKREKYWATDLRQLAMQLPSERNGYTADDSKVENEDGSLNMLYSYWTQEVFYDEVTDMLERILNPVYGSWETYQYSESMDGAYPVLSNIFSSLIDPDALAAGSGMDAIPVFADWNGDDYGLGDQLLSYDEGNRWVGQVNEINGTFEFNENTGQYDVILVANVTYSAWTKDKGTLTKDGVLTLNLGANVDKKVPTPNKVIIKSSKLEF